MAAPAAAAAAAGGVVPAQLGFLAIFNPSLGSSDETIDDQIVYYASVTTQSSARRKRRARARPTDAVSQEERHERLRQIGLAQGMVSFGRGFADGAPVDAIDTEKSRVVAHELEPGWWVLASIDLTRVPLPPRLPTKTGDKQEERYEYSSREMKPAALLLRDLLRAHSIFLLHHDSSLGALFVRYRRSKFVAILSRYWHLFLSTWNVMLHGNPARDVFGGINIAASGELGVGVGEEDRGSGEREVLEGLVGRVEGLVDLVVSRFGGYDAAASDAKKTDKAEPEIWLGSGKEPDAEDGAIFLGTGALSRKSLRDVTHWMEDLYTWGEHAYGVIESPTSVRRARAGKASKAADADVDADDSPKPKADPDPPAEVAEPAESREPTNDQQQPPEDHVQGQADKDTEAGKLDKMVSYLTLGYGSYWSFPKTSGVNSPAESPDPRTPESKPKDNKEEPSKSQPKTPARTPSYESTGRYLIGLKGEIEDEAPSDADLSQGSEDPETGHNSRTVLRTIHVELESKDQPDSTFVKDFAAANPAASPLNQSHAAWNMPPGYDAHDLDKAEKLRVVVYVNKPFIFTFLFRLRTDSLAWATLYRSLHYQLAPLRKPLLASTKYRPERPGAAGPAASSIYDLVWDPPSLAVHSTIPNIPNIPDYYHYYLPADSPSPQAWSRADAVSTHIHLLNIYAATRSRAADLERTQKTNRGWWIVWTRVFQRQPNAAGQHHNLSTIHESAASTSSSLGSQGDASTTGPATAAAAAVGKEIFLIRRASDHVGFRISSDDVASGGADGASKLAHGIGVDTRRYVEELLSLL